MKNRSGITLIALVVTIIVLIILAGVTISLVIGNNGIIGKASDAQIMQAIGSIKEGVELEKGASYIEQKQLTAEDLLAKGKLVRTIQQGDSEEYQIYYIVKENAFNGMGNIGKGVPATLKDVFLMDDKLNVSYISSNGKKYGDNLEEKILEDETQIKFASEEFSKYIAKISGVQEEQLKFKWMKNQTKLVIADKNITSLEDLIFFPNLIELQIGNVPSVDYPNAGGMKLDTLEGIVNCTKLARLTLRSVVIERLEGIEENNHIVYFGGIECRVNDYTGIEKCKNLKEISLNSVAGLDTEKFILNIKELENIEILAIGNNKNLPSLKVLEEMKSLNLKRLNLTNMGIKDCRGVERFKRLTSLALGGNQIQDISSLVEITNLVELSLINNKIEDITPIAQLTNLERLEIYGNQIQDILPLANNSKLKVLYLKNNPNIDANRNNYTGERLEKLNKIGEILDRGGSIILDKDKLGLFNNYRVLDLGGQNLETLDILDGMTEIVELTLSGNQLTLEDERSKQILKKMTKLKNIVLSSNPNLQDISALNGLTSLQYIFLLNTNADLKGIEDIISNVQIQIGEEQLMTLENCDVNKVTRLNLIIYGSSNKYEKFPDLSKFVNMTSITIPNLRLDSWSFIAQLSNLERLSLTNCDLHDKMIDFSRLTRLTSVNLSDNHLSTKDIEKLRGLKNNRNLVLNLNNNSIIDATVLLELDSSSKIYLQNNVNLTQDSKDKLKAKFGSNNVIL